MKYINFFLLLSTVVVVIASCGTKVQKKTNKSYSEIALEESAVPVRPGIPGERPFWNTYAKRFIYAPAFDFKEVEKAQKYRFELLSLADSSTYKFESAKPFAALSPVWSEVPVGNVELKVIALSAGGDRVGLAGERNFYRAAPFNGVYHEPVMPYDKSAMVALETLLEEDYVKYWLEHKEPDPDYKNFRYPAKIYSALVIGAVTYARLKPNTPEVEKSAELARIVADFMLDIRYKPGTAWEYFVPTYYGEFNIKRKPHMNPVNNFTIMGVDAGHAFLDMYDFTNEEKYLDAAKKIAQTYIKNQMENGSWYQFVNHATGEPIAENIVIPTAEINYFDRLKNDYGVSGLENFNKKALAYIMENPVKTFDWQGQFEDVYARPPYKNLSREQSCELAMYLLGNNKEDENHLELAEELIKFSEDQFVIWEQPMPKQESKRGPGFNSENWITPCVIEQYVFWNPVIRSTEIMIGTYWKAYEVTKNEMYLAKAKSLANSITLLQQAHDGEIPTFSTKYEMPLWLNSPVYSTKRLMTLEQDLSEHGE